MAKLNVEDLTAAIKASAQATAEAAATAAVNAIDTQQNNQVVVHREPNIQPFEASGDNLTQGIELLDYIDQYNWICASARITEAAELKKVDKVYYWSDTLRLFFGFLCLLVSK